MKKSIVTIVAFMLFALAGFAQEKYEYMIITSDGSLTLRVITKDNEELIKVKANQILPSLLTKVDEMQNSGWEVYNSNTYGDSWFLHVYYLRKKKQ